MDTSQLPGPPYVLSNVQMFSSRTLRTCHSSWISNAIYCAAVGSGFAVCAADPSPRFPTIEQLAGNPPPLTTTASTKHPLPCNERTLSRTSALRR